MKYTPYQIKQLDTIARARCLARGACERCGTTKDLVWAHIFTKARKSTRWSMDNCFCLCQPFDAEGCHRLLDASRKVLLREFAIEKMGEAAYYDLMQRSTQPATLTYDQILQDRVPAKIRADSNYWEPPE